MEVSVLSLKGKTTQQWFTTFKLPAST